MEAAYLADLENNHLGKPAVHKIRVLEKVLLKLKNPLFSNYFLDKGGLEQFHNFLKKLPDGSWPLSSIRTSVLETLLDLPYNEHHLKYTKLGKTLTALQNSKSEHEENKKIIQEVKDKWLRIVAGQKIEYSNLENFEKENEKLMKKKRKRSTAQVVSAEQNFEDGGDGLAGPDPSKAVKMSYNFSIRPFSNLNKRDARSHESSKTEEIDKYLSRIRKQTKQS